MKTAAPAVPLPRSRAADYVELTKPRIAVMALFTVAAGAWLASLLLVACTALLRRRKRHPARVAARCSISPSTNTRTLGGMRRALG